MIWYSFLHIFATTDITSSIASIAAAVVNLFEHVADIKWL